MFSAVLDTCVLVPGHLRDVLLETAARGVYRAVWSGRILDELGRTIRSLRAARGDAESTIDAYVWRLTRQMGAAFPDALVTAWQPFETTIALPDADDRHVVAAAVAGRADVIVTENLKHFPPQALPPPLLAQSADEFLLDALDLHEEIVLGAIRAVAARTGRFGLSRSARDIALILRAAPASQFGEAALALLGED